MDLECRLIQVCTKALCAMLYQKLCLYQEIPYGLLSLVQMHNRSYAQGTLVDLQDNHPAENLTVVDLESQFLTENYTIKYIQFFSTILDDETSKDTGR